MTAADLPGYDLVHVGNNLVNSFEKMNLTAGTETNSGSGASGVGVQLEKIVAVTVRDGVLFMGVKWEGLPTVEFVNVNTISHKWPLKLIEYYESHLVILENPQNGVQRLEQKDIDEFIESIRRNTMEEYGMPTEIVDALISNQNLFIVVRWVKGNMLGCIPAPIAHKIFPNMLISFYESRIIWN